MTWEFPEWARSNVRHPMTIMDKARATPNKRLGDTKIHYRGFDMETNIETGEPRLLCDSRGAPIFDSKHGPRSRFDSMKKWVHHLGRKGVTLVSWSQFDHRGLFRVFTDAMSLEDADLAVARHGRLNPACYYKGLSFSTFNNMQSIRIEDETHPRGFRQVGVVDAKKFLQSNLEDACKQNGLDWYEKGPTEVHLIDWKRYDREKDYRDRVVKSCYMDALAAESLIHVTEENFYSIFGVYPKTLSSTGGLAKSAIAATVGEDYKAVNFYDQMKDWLARDQDFESVMETWRLSHESFNAGLIEAYAVGNAGNAWTADISSAYPTVISRLSDLRGSTIIRGTGEPPRVFPSPEGMITDYILIRGTVECPQETFHTIGYKNAGGNRTRPAGVFKAAYNIMEREFLLEQGGRFFDEEWVHIKTKGLPSPLSIAASKFLDMREEIRLAEGKWTSKETVPKISGNSIYGCCYEHIDLFEDDGWSGIFCGHKTGELYNPLYAGYITALTRLTLSLGIRIIHKNGGRPILAMTDSVNWNGNGTELPKDIRWGGGINTGWRKKKTTGYFEPPEQVFDFQCYGTGRYEYMTKEGVSSGGGFTDQEDLEDIKEFLKVKSRSYFLKEQNGQKQTFRRSIENALSDRGSLVPEPVMIHSKVITPGLVRQTKEYTPRDINLIFEEEKGFKPFDMGMKRVYGKEYRQAKIAGGHRGPYRLALEQLIPTFQPSVDERGIPYELLGLDNTMDKYREGHIERVKIEGPKLIPKDDKKPTKKKAKKSPKKKPKPKPKKKPMSPEERRTWERERKREYRGKVNAK